MATNCDQDQNCLLLAIKNVKSLKQAITHLEAAHKAQDVLVSFLSFSLLHFLLEFSLVFFRPIVPYFCFS